MKYCSILGLIFAHHFQQSVDSGELPKEWTLANISPLFKKGDIQRDIDRLGNWAREWGMRFKPVKCYMMQLKRKKSNKLQASYI